MFVGVWMAIGFILRLDANTYLLLGVPITIGFQLLIRKESLAALWMRSAPELNIAKWKAPAQLVGIIFALANAMLLYEYYFASHSLILVLYELVAICGSLPLAYACHNFTRPMIRPLIMCFATAGVLAVALDTITYWLRVFELHAQLPVSVGDFVYVWVVSMVQYLPVVFLIEEVWFRGAFDSHVYHLGDRNPNLTALYVSLLWGVWHFPIAYAPSAGLAAGIGSLASLMIFQGAVGYFLSLYWRRSGNLLVPGSVHAFADSVRNGFSLF
jgi:hypothetical protein